MSPNKIQIVVVVNGVETTVDANLNAPLQTVAQHALNETGHQGRPLSDWEFKDAHGNPLDLQRKVGDFHFASGVILYLTLTVGVNGAGCRRGASSRAGGRD
jgi:hypothetical protein